MSKSKGDSFEPYGWIKDWEPVWDIIHPDTPLPEEPIIPTMDKKVVIEAAVTGWMLPQLWWDRGVPHLPPGSHGGDTCIDEQVDAIVECVRAGASCIHLHPRHPSDGHARLHDVELFAEIVDRALEQEDFITTSHAFTWDFRKAAAVDFITGAAEFLERGTGNRYLQACLMPMVPTYTENHYLITDKAMVEGTRFLEEKGIRILFSLQAQYLSQWKRALLDTGVARSKPHMISLMLGKHSMDMQFDDPWSYLNVINSMSLVNSAIPDEEVFIGLQPGGRNWLPVTVMALLYGAQYVRVGIEDIYWVWPHKDEIFQTVTQSTKMIADLCGILGREVATVDEARKIMAIKRTS